MSILETIKAHKLNEVAERKALYPAKLLEKSVFFETPCVSLTKYLSHPSRKGIIAEFKRKSPSKGFINRYANPQEVGLGYMQAGASAISVLTDSHFFGAKPEDILTIRKFNYCPILRKDFMLDEYQILEAKSMGADAILLIAKMIDAETAKALATLAKSLSLEVFVEFHTQEEIEQYTAANVLMDVVGINNRNLNTFQVDIEHSIALANFLPTSVLKVAESGLEKAETILTLKENGFTGFLIGEYFMRNANPALACRKLIKELEILETKKVIKHSI
ncbi:MAG: indole-3-glycerol phosphate synthase TrpC [Luteibaculaceae bacterium]